MILNDNGVCFLGCKNILAHRLCYAEFFYKLPPFITILYVLIIYLGREFVINLKGECLKGNCLVDVAAKGYREKSNFVLDAKDSTRIELLLPSELPVGKKAEVAFTFTYAGEKYKRKLTIDPM